LIYCNLDIAGFEDNPQDSLTFNYLIGPFHRQEITGLDICIRKQLIATCSKDKTINIWNVAERRLEIEPTPTPEECLAIAFHPSGLHLVVALNDKIQLMNLHADKLRPDKIWPTRNCYDIKFSHGGHMFAAVSNKDIHVHNFYTNDCPDSMMYSGHMQRVNRIDWFENDMGFVSCSSDGGIYFYDLYTHTLEK
jgi:WD40 repeat protein